MFLVIPLRKAKRMKEISGLRSTEIRGLLS